MKTVILALASCLAVARTASAARRLRGSGGGDPCAAAGATATRSYQLTAATLPRFGGAEMNCEYNNNFDWSRSSPGLLDVDGATCNFECTSCTIDADGPDGVALISTNDARPWAAGGAFLARVGDAGGDGTAPVTLTCEARATSLAFRRPHRRQLHHQGLMECREGEYIATGVWPSPPVRCYTEPCADGYDGRTDGLCWENCPEGWTNAGFLCTDWNVGSPTHLKTIARKSYSRGAGRRPSYGTIHHEFTRVVNLVSCRGERVVGPCV